MRNPVLVGDCVQSLRWYGAGMASVAFLGMLPVWTLPAADIPASPGGSAGAPLKPVSSSLAVRDLTQLVLERNEALQARHIEFEIARKRVQAEKGIFEPEFVGSYERVENKRRNTAEQQSQQILLNSSRIFAEHNNVYNAGLEGLVPIGGRVRLGYSLRDLDNNLQPSLGLASEYQSFAGLSLTQPLLRNFGMVPTLANLRLAAAASRIAFEEYRRQLMLTLSTAEGAYWNLYLAQEQSRFFRESVALAETIFKDAKAKLDAGKGSELEMMEAQSALSLRQSRLVDAEQRRFEAASRVAVLYGETTSDTVQNLTAADSPESVPFQGSFQQSAQKAIQQNPDYLAQQHKITSENIRLAYAKNQRLPQLDLKASYGLNGLAETVSDSMDQITHGGYASWSAGVEMRIPLTGGVRSRRELEMSRLKTQQVLRELKDLETQIYNSLENAHRKIITTKTSITNYQQVVAFNETLLKSQVQRLEAGRLEPRKVLEVEADLLEARSAAAEALVQHRRAQLELELIEGSYLSARQMELDPKALGLQTRSWLTSGGDKPEKAQH